jgi:hypothetical protein
MMIIIEVIIFYFNDKQFLIYRLLLKSIFLVVYYFLNTSIYHEECTSVPYEYEYIANSQKQQTIIICT